MNVAVDLEVRPQLVTTSAKTLVRSSQLHARTVPFSDSPPLPSHGYVKAAAVQLPHTHYTYASYVSTLCCYRVVEGGLDAAFLAAWSSHRGTVTVPRATKRLFGR